MKSKYSHLPLKDKPERMIKVIAYSFQYGVLYLRHKLAKTMSDETVAEEFGVGKGPLLTSELCLMSQKYLNSLDEFTEQ